MGLYAMFGALPLGLFARLPGNARQRAGTLLSVLPSTSCSAGRSARWQGAAAHARYAAADLGSAAGRQSEAAAPAAFTRPDPPHRPTARTGDLAPDAEAWPAGVLQDLARTLDVTERRQPRRETRC
ncbi:hypothetical protein [Streptomyces noursei]|uniref:hypothetical protein n=1 Tax=Streptomyces noursei TaxID=1971 RepID=UPI0008366D55